MKDKELEALLGLPAEQKYPEKLPIIPVAYRPIFPGVFTPLMISSEDDKKVIEEAQKSDGYLGLVLLKNDKESPTSLDLYKI